MNRRHVLARFGAATSLTAVAGCLGGDDDQTSDDQVASDPWREAPDISDLQISTGGEVGIDVRIKNHGTFSRPPVLALTVTVSGNAPRTLGPFRGVDVPFNATQLMQANGSEALWLLSGDAVVAAGDCWVPDDDGTAFDDRFLTLDPDESASEELAIVPDIEPNIAETVPSDDRPNCYRVDVYHGETSVDVWQANVDYDDLEPGEHLLDEVTLGIDVTLD